MSILNVDAYPCYWPEGWQRTQEWKRTKSKYSVDFVRSRDDIVRQLKLLGAREIVVSTNIPLRRDGLPLAGMSEPKDPSVAVYWAEHGAWDAATRQQTYKHRVVACDHWRTVRENLRAVGLAIDALRALKRTGASEIIDKAFTGFMALPAHAGSSSWRTVLFGDMAGIAGMGPLTREDVENAYKRATRIAHPDLGGSHEQIVRVNQAYQDALREIG